MVGLGRLELPTSPLSGVRSSHLSYRPVNNLQTLDFVGVCSGVGSQFVWHKQRISRIIAAQSLYRNQLVLRRKMSCDPFVRRSCGCRWSAVDLSRQDPYVPPSKNGEQRLLGPRHWFEDTVKTAGLRDFSRHDLRRTFPSRLAMQGVVTLEIDQIPVIRQSLAQL
jgi:hypothetical protein